jgi:hypothetical protein
MVCVNAGVGHPCQPGVAQLHAEFAHDVLIGSVTTLLVPLGSLGTSVDRGSDARGRSRGQPRLG